MESKASAVDTESATAAAPSVWATGPYNSFCRNSSARGPRVADRGSGGGAKRGPTPAASGSSQHDAGYAARMAAGRLQYACHGCGMHGHWKKDGECNPADVAAFMKKKMAEQAKKDAEEEEAEDSGKDIYWLFYSYIIFIPICLDLLCYFGLTGTKRLVCFHLLDATLQTILDVEIFFALQFPRVLIRSPWNFREAFKRLVGTVGRH
jgi:hypothetical protein